MSTDAKLPSSMPLPYPAGPPIDTSAQPTAYHQPPTLPGQAPPPGFYVAPPPQAGGGYPSQPPSYFQPHSDVPPPDYYAPHTTTTAVTVQPGPIREQVIVVGNCPACRIGMVVDNFTCMGILCCIFFFPFGFICCFLLKNRICTNCKTTFG